MVTMKKTLLMTIFSPSFSFMVQLRSGVLRPCSNRSKSIPQAFYSSRSTPGSHKLRNSLSENNDTIEEEQRISVTGMIYEAESSKEVSGTDVFPNVQLYTKEGCTLCDKAKDVLELLREELPHSLEAIDITDPDKTDFYDRYKWDIPVLHLNGLYWTKHRLTIDEARLALDEAKAGTFEAQRGEPNAAAMENKIAERKAN